MKPFKYNPNFHSGLFRHRIVIQHYKESENDMGDTIVDWVDYAAPWAMIKTVKGREFVQASAVRGETTVRFITRYMPGITNDMRIKYDGRTFEITAPPINDDEMNETLTIIAKEVV